MLVSLGNLRISANCLIFFMIAVNCELVISFCFASFGLLEDCDEESHMVHSMKLLCYCTVYSVHVGLIVDLLLSYTVAVRADLLALYLL